MKPHYYLFILAIGLLTTTSCVKKGCTDPHASNFDWNATQDDGNCEYKGCTDKTAKNYDPDAREDDGTCIYTGLVKFYSTRDQLSANNVFIDVEVSGKYIGSIRKPCPATPTTCNSTCDFALQDNLDEGAYTYQYWVIKQTGSTMFDTLFASQQESVFIIGKVCTPKDLK